MNKGKGKGENCIKNGLKTLKIEPFGFKTLKCSGGGGLSKIYQS